MAVAVVVVVVVSRWSAVKEGERTDPIPVLIAAAIAIVAAVTVIVFVGDRR